MTYLKIPFLKMHGLGNDFIVIDDLSAGKSATQRETPLNPEVARRMCDRRFGIGADQILWLRDPENADARMEIFNADGSMAEMCGNGIRAAALFLHDRGPRPGQREYAIETLAGLIQVQLNHRSVTVNMGAPVIGDSLEGEPIEIQGETLRFTDVDMGNPHAVIFVSDVVRFPVESEGPLIENHRRFPKRTNVEFVEVVNPSEIRVRVWERGAGITLACGTGACASAVATISTGKGKSPLQVHLPGGTLQISWEGAGKPVIMTGPAEEVFEGIYFV